MHAVHVGYHKTGSTWLQHCVFPALVEFAPYPHPVLGSLVGNLATAGDDDYYGEAIAAVVRRTEQSGSRLLISSELISGNPWDDASMGERNARRLAAVMPGARVVMFIRRQAEMLRALHAQYVNEGGAGSLNDFLTGDTPGLTFDFRQLEYDRLVQVYFDLFGIQNVLVLAYERLRALPVETVAAVCDFIGARPPSMLVQQRLNPSLSPLPLLALRAWNRSFRVSRFNTDPLVTPLRGGRRVREVLQRFVDPVARRLPFRDSGAEPALLEVHSRRYAESNTRLEKQTGLDLGVLGYPLS